MGAEQERAPWREFNEQDPWGSGSMGSRGSGSALFFWAAVVHQELTVGTNPTSLEIMMLLFKNSIVAWKHNAPFRHHCGVVKEAFYL